MKNRQMVMGMLAVVLVFGLIFVGCEQSTNSSEGGNVTTDNKEEENINSENKRVTIENITGLTGQVGVWIFANLPENSSAPINEAICSGGITDNNVFSQLLTVPRNNTYTTDTVWTGTGGYYVALIPIVNNSYSQTQALVYTGGGGTPVKVDFNKAETTLEYSEFKLYSSL